MKGFIFMLKSDLSLRKRMIFGLIFFSILAVILIIRIYILQFVINDDLQLKAEKQQSSSRNIGAKRGTIYDCTGKNILAISSTVYTVTVNPMKIDLDKKDILAQKLSEIFELDYDKVLKRVNKKSSIETIAKRVDIITMRLIICIFLFITYLTERIIIRYIKTVNEASAKIPDSTAISRGTQYAPKASYPVFI